MVDSLLPLAAKEPSTSLPDDENPEEIERDNNSFQQKQNNVYFGRSASKRKLTFETVRGKVRKLAVSQTFIQDGKKKGFIIFRIDNTK